MCLAKAVDAEVIGCDVGSKAFEFKPRLTAVDIVSRNLKVQADSAASILLVFQAVLPFLLFAADENSEQTAPITITIQGGTNVSFSLSYEYLDQVLFPALERFDVKVERKLEFRGWCQGTRQIGSAKFTISPLKLGQSLKAPQWPKEQGTVNKIDVSLIVPRHILDPLKQRILAELQLVFPDSEIVFVLLEDSRHNARNYALLVAHTTTGLLFGRDWLYDGRTKDKPIPKLVAEISKRVVRDLDAELKKGGVVDEHLQDQLVIFQALAEGSSSIPGTEELLNSTRERVERTDEPFGEGSLHTTTARWVASQFLPAAKWIDKGRICHGVGWKQVAPIGTTEDEASELTTKTISNLHIS